MRQQDKIIIWPVYFDSTKSRKNGRRVPKSVAVSFPKVAEVKDAAEKLGFPCELVADAGHSRTPWMKTGMVLVKKKGSKVQVLLSLAKQICKVRAASASK